MYDSKNGIFFEDTWNFLREVYDFCHKVKGNLIGFQDNCTSLQLMYLMRMADTLRIIMTAGIMGYPDQAGMLCSSLWEMTHTVIYFDYNPDAIQNYLKASQDPEPKKMPEILSPGLKWEKVSEKNYNYIFKNLSEAELKNKATQEYKVYRRLCKIKHSSPFHVNRFKKINDTENEVLFGPYSHDQKQFDLLEAGREILMATDIIINKINDSELKKEQEELKNGYLIKRNEFGKTIK